MLPRHDSLQPSGTACRSVVQVIAALALLALVTAPAAAQQRRIELVPEFGYTFGGGFDFPSNFFTGIASGGKIVLDDSPSYGATLGFEGRRGTYFTLSYVYQGTKIGVDWNQTPPPSSGVDPNFKGDIGLHKVLFGGRQEFIKSSEQKLRPYIGGGLGFVVLDPNFVTPEGDPPQLPDRFHAVPQRRAALHVRRGEALRPSGGLQGLVVLGAVRRRLPVVRPLVGLLGRPGASRGRSPGGTVSAGAIIKF
ncbi:MAG: hypothetical protein MZV64_30025 [Ignavibacteriales bacterium]|nr:hypothetical protein [Ignavibacteriales bacterium]